MFEDLHVVGMLRWRHTVKKEKNLEKFHLISTFRVTPDDGLIAEIYILSVLFFQFCDTQLVVPPISMNMYHLELTMQ